MSKRHFPLTLRHLLLRVLKVFSKTENEVSTVRKIAHPYYGEISQIDRLSFLFCSKHGEDALVTVTFLQFIPLNFQESCYGIYFHVSRKWSIFNPVGIFQYDSPH